MPASVPAIGRAPSGLQPHWRTTLGQSPCPFSDFYIARARALAARGGDRWDAAALAAELERLRDEGERLGLRVALPAIERTINEMRG